MCPSAEPRIQDIPVLALRDPTRGRQSRGHRQVILKPIEQATDLLAIRGAQMVGAPNRVGHLEHAAAMAIGRMLVDGHEPDENTPLHGRMTARETLRFAYRLRSAITNSATVSP
jgi:hypothetical protein